jgi:Cu-Zn family superoxide dismutase
MLLSPAHRNRKTNNTEMSMNARQTLMFGALLLTGCAGISSSGPTAVAQLQPTQGNNVSGTTTFSQQGDKVAVEADIKGLTPGLHGFHVHEKGDCSAPDGASAGGHFNPSGKPHGGTSGTERHGGDLGNLIADADGKAILKITIEGVSVAKDAPNSVVGRGLIVHADPDDYKTQPTGNSGKRLACAVITAN